MDKIIEKVNSLEFDKATWTSYRFDQIAFNIGERIEPTNTDLEIYVGLEHLDPDSIHIRRFGKKEDVTGTKLRVYPGDIIFGRRRAYQRKAAIANFDGFCSAHAMVLRANSKVVDPALFPFFIHSDTFMHRAIDISVGSLSPTINWGTMKKQEFLLPPKPQQAKIAELLWAADEIEQKEMDVLNKLSKFNRIYLSSLFEDRNVQKYILLKTLYKKPFKTVNPSAFGNDIVYHYSLPSFIEKKSAELVISSSIKSNKILIDRDCVLFSKLNPNQPKVWEIIDWDDHLKLGSTEWLPVLPNNEIGLPYLFAFLSSEHFIEKVMKFVQGSSNSHQRVDPSRFYKLEVPLLQKEVIARIEEYHKKSLKTENELQTKIIKTKSINKFLINQIF